MWLWPRGLWGGEGGEQCLSRLVLYKLPPILPAAPGCRQSLILLAPRAAGFTNSVIRLAHLTCLFVGLEASAVWCVTGAGAGAGAGERWCRLMMGGPPMRAGAPHSCCKLSMWRFVLCSVYKRIRGVGEAEPSRGDEQGERWNKCNEPCWSDRTKCFLIAPQQLPISSASPSPSPSLQPSARSGLALGCCAVISLPAPPTQLLSPPPSSSEVELHEALGSPASQTRCGTD